MQVIDVKIKRRKYLLSSVFKNGTDLNTSSEL